MAGEWRTVKVQDIAASAPNALSTGPFGSAISSQFFEPAGVPVLRGSNLSEDVGHRLITENLVYVSREKAREFRRSAAHRGDLVFTCWGTINQIGLIDERSPYDEYIVSNKQMKLTPDPAKADSLFLYYLFSGPEISSRILAEGIGSSVPGFNLGQLRNMRLSLPPLCEQRAIASVLGALDDKIEMNRRINHSLESMARAIFKSWFVDFDPVRAKAEGRQPVGMDAETAALFGRGWQESELGTIPAGWHVATVGRIAEVTDCLHSKKPERVAQGSPLLQLWNILDNGLMDMADTYYIADADYAEWTSRMEARPGDCVITNVGRVGAVAQVPHGLRAALGRNMTGLRCRAQYPFPAFLIGALTSSAMAEEIALKTDSGTILDSLNVRSIPHLRFVIGPVELLQGYESVARPLRAKMERALAENGVLCAIRDSLLPKLLSGEIRIRDAEKAIEAHV